MASILFRSFSKLRHSRGFGVHSPLAYELISSVLPDEPAYYGDSVIETMFSVKRQRRIARIILRLAVRFHPCTASVSPTYEPAIRLANSKITFIKGENADMCISTSEGKHRIRIGHPKEDYGPLVLDNETDLEIVVYRKGLSPTLIKTKI